MKRLYNHPGNILQLIAHPNSAKIREQFTSTAIGLPDLDSTKLARLLSGAISSYTEYKIVNYGNKL